jgi:glc operon protein GlcG
LNQENYYHAGGAMKAAPFFKLTQEGADIIVNTAVEKAKELKQIVSIAVVDSGGHLFSFKRMTNGRTHNTMIALAKARSAALTTAATGKTNREGGEIPDHQVLAQTLAVGPGWFISIEGGIPLTIEGQCIGAVGVSGAPAAVDKQICQAGVDAFNKAD